MQMMMMKTFSNRFEPIIRVVLPLMHLAGFIGLQLSISQSFFKALVPFHLLASLGLLLIFHRDWHKSAVVFCITAYLMGFLVELLGVHTGMVFGQYLYGQTLGWKIMEIPLVIGANWLVLIYCAGVVANNWHISTPIKTSLAALLVVGLDVLIEPVAMKLDFWNWADSIVPLQNYVAWYFISWVLLYFFYRLPFQKENHLAGLLLACQALFFAGHNLAFMALN
jgi:putative membrane protein